MRAIQLLRRSWFESGFLVSPVLGRARGSGYANWTSNFLPAFTNTDPNTTIGVEYGSDLDGWTAAQHGVNGVTIEDATDLGGGFHQVTVAVPRTLDGGSGKLFARLRVAVITP